MNTYKIVKIYVVEATDKIDAVEKLANDKTGEYLISVTCRAMTEKEKSWTELVKKQLTGK